MTRRNIADGFDAAKMGYKQELRRAYSTVQIFAVAFSIMGLVPSIASTIAFSLPAGPAGMVWVCSSSLFQRDNKILKANRKILMVIGVVDCEYSYSFYRVIIGIYSPSPLKRQTFPTPLREQLLITFGQADISSAMPTAGGLYWWTHYFAADRYKHFLSFMVGYSNTMGLIGGICSVDCKPECTWGEG